MDETERRVAVTPERRARWLVVLGRRAQSSGDYEQAYERFERAKELDEDSADAWRGFGEAAFQLGYRFEARRARRQANRLEE